MTQKLPLKDILAVIDFNGRDVWKELNRDQRKQVGFWVLNRWASSVTGNREKQELAVLKTNEYFNKDFINISAHLDNGHPELMWQLLCLSGNTGRSEYHKWIGHKKKATRGNSNAAIKLLETIYPNMKPDEVELLARINTKKQLKQLAEEHGIEGVKL